MSPRCPLHGCAMQLEDRDGSYGQELWVCREYSAGCREVARTGPSEHEILRREHVG